MQKEIEISKKIKFSRQTIALTGAGISTASGIPDFRGTNGLWKRYNPSDYAHINTFNEDPGKAWELALKLLDLAHQSEPCSAHKALTAMEEKGFLHGIITQNIDNLHQRSGSRNVINYHGSIYEAVCIDCNVLSMNQGETPPMCRICGRIMKPGYTFFGETVSSAAFLEARNLASYSDVFMVVGTSAFVQPAADLPFIAKKMALI